MLLPGIRISFMVLTKDLCEAFDKNAYRFAQTASKTEQIALCQYIRDGHINSQIRKIRRLYSAKTKDFADLLKQHLPNADISIGENTLQIMLKAKFDKDVSVFEKNGIAVFVENNDKGYLTLVISPSGIPNDKLENAVIALKNAIYN